MLTKSLTAPPIQVPLMCNVLVIDDERMILGLVEQILERMDYKVETAENGNMGIDKFDAGNYDLVITDIFMPGADGIQVVDHIRKSRRKGTPVIGMSGTPWKLADHTFDRVIPKPFQIASLMETARTLTDGRPASQN
jgi:DNA-binding response OmpR family regulator